jgi:hypothetical protein
MKRYRTFSLASGSYRRLFQDGLLPNSGGRDLSITGGLVPQMEHADDWEGFSSEIRSPLPDDSCMLMLLSGTQPSVRGI